MQYSVMMESEKEAFEKTYETTLKYFVISSYFKEIPEVTERVLKVDTELKD